MRELTVDQIIGIHNTILSSGEDGRVLSEANLHQLVFLVNRENDPVYRASLAAFHLVAYPPFREGNMRTACGVARQILDAEGFQIPGMSDDFFTLLQGVKDFNVEIEDIATWLRKNF